MTRQSMLETAKEQSAWEMSCSPSDFSAGENRIFPWKLSAKARKYYSEPIACNIVTYGDNLVAATREEYRKIVTKYIQGGGYDRLEIPELHWLDNRLRREGMLSCFMAEYWLPDPEAVTPLPISYATRMLGPSDFASLYLPEWSNALCEKRRELDVLGIGAYDGDRLIGFAACSADCDTMRQIGIDVLPAYRGQGIASALTSRLAGAIMDEGKVPFYCCAWSNIASARNAIRAGFRPAWAELTCKPIEKVREYIDKR